MGMSASQVRFLSLQSRKNRIGRDLTTLSNRKMALSRDMNNVARRYTNALNNIDLKWSNDHGDNYSNIDYEMLMRPNAINWETPCIVTDKNGNVVVDNATTLIGYVGTDAEGNKIFDDLSTIGKTTISNGPMAGQALTYENLAKWITTSTVSDGTSGKLGLNSEGQTTGSANPTAYIIPTGIQDYSFENGLRYQIFEELGLVDPGTSTAYRALLNEYYGSEIACSFGDYSALLQEFIKAGTYGIPSSPASHINEIGGVAVSGADGDYDTYFGPNGCLLGKLALAQYAMTEYDRWCNELKQFNLGEPTTHTFTATNGKTHDFVCPALLNYNSAETGTTTNYVNPSDVAVSATGSAILDGTSGQAYGNPTTAPYKYGVEEIGSEAYDAYNEIYNNDAWVNMGKDGSPLDSILQFLSLMDESFTEGSKHQNNLNGQTWQFNPDDTLVDHTVTVTNNDGSTTEMDVAEAAQRYAMEQCVKFYKKTFAEGKNYELGVGREYYGDMDNKAANLAEEQWTSGTEGGGTIDEYQGVVSETRKYKWWEWALSLLATIVEFAAYTALGSVVMDNLLDAFGVNVLSDLGDGLGENFEIATFGSASKGYAFNLANVEKSYYTYYEMYMQAFQDTGVNLLNGSNAADNEIHSSYNDDTVMALIDEFGGLSDPSNVHMISHANNPISMEDALCHQTLFDTAIDANDYLGKTTTTYTDVESAYIKPSFCDVTVSTGSSTTAGAETYVDPSGVIYTGRNIYKHVTATDIDCASYYDTTSSSWKSTSGTSLTTHFDGVNLGGLSSYYDSDSNTWYKGFTKTYHTCTDVDYSGILRTFIDGNAGERYTVMDDGAGNLYYEGYFNDGTSYSLVNWTLKQNHTASGKTYYDHVYVVDPANDYNNYYKNSNGSFYIAKQVPHEVNPGVKEDRKWQLPPIEFTVADGTPVVNTIKYQLDETTHGGAFIYTCTDGSETYMDLYHYSMVDDHGNHLWGFYAFDQDDNGKKDFKLYRSEFSDKADGSGYEGGPLTPVIDPHTGELITTFERYKFNCVVYKTEGDNPSVAPNPVGTNEGFMIQEVTCNDETGALIQLTKTYFFKDYLTHTDHGNDMDMNDTADNVDYCFNIVQEISDGNGHVKGYKYYSSSDLAALVASGKLYDSSYKKYMDCIASATDTQPKTTQTYTKTSYTNNEGSTLSVAVDGSKFTKTVSLYITPSQDFRDELQRDVDAIYDEISAYNTKLASFFSAREQKLMDYYDALFSRIGENGWVCDTNINKKMSAGAVEQSRTYINNKLQNNEYFLTECTHKEETVGYRFTMKQATGIMKIFQVHDHDAESQAYAEYECDKKIIADKEAAIDERMAELETEQECIETELESIKKIRNKNIDRYFKIFG